MQEKVNEWYGKVESEFNEHFNNYDKAISFDIKKTVDVRVKDFKPGSHESVDTKADEETGETAVMIPEALAITIIGGAAAVIGAGTGGEAVTARKRTVERKAVIRCA